MHSSNLLVKQLQVEMSSLQRVIQCSDEEILAMDTNKVLDEDDLNTLTQQLCLLRREKAASQAEVQRLMDQLEGLRGSYADGYREADSLQRELKESEAFLAVATDANERSRVRIADLEAEVKRILEEKSKLESELSLLREKMATMESEMQLARQETEKASLEDSEMSDAMETPSFSHSSPSPQRPKKEPILSPEGKRVSKICEDDKEVVSLKKELKEANDRCTRLQQTIQSKYTEFMEMKERVTTIESELGLLKEYSEKLEHYNERLSQSLSQAKTKYEKLRSRNKELEKTKMTQERLESIRRVITVKNELKAMNKDLLEKNAKATQEAVQAKQAKMKVEEELELAQKRVKECELKIEELEGDLREAQNNTSTSSYGSSRAFLEQENLRLTVKIDELKQQVEELKRKGGVKLDTPPGRKTPIKRTKDVQSPAKLSKLSDFDLDDPSKCQTQ